MIMKVLWYLIAIAYLFEASWICWEACSTSKAENCNSRMRTASCKKITIHTSYFHADNMLAVCTHNKTSQPLPHKFTNTTLFYVSQRHSPTYSERNYKWASRRICRYSERLHCWIHAVWEHSRLLIDMRVFEITRQWYLLNDANQVFRNYLLERSSLSRCNEIYMYKSAGNRIPHFKIPGENRPQA